MAAAQNGVPIEYEQVDVKPQLNGVHLPNGRPHHPQPPPQPKTHPETEHNFRQDGRFRRILIFFARVILHLIIWDILGGRVPLFRLAIRQSRPRRFRRWAHAFRELALNMGGVMIKLGQFLSARVDVLPPEITEELQGLQDEVTPEETGRIMAVIQAELGDFNGRFAEIEAEPMAAASLGQTHRAWLKPQNGAGARGEAVVIKVQRPNIAAIVETDLAALRIVARWTMRYKPIARRADVPALMEEFAKTLWEELNYCAEVDNAERFAEMYANDPRVYIPAMYRQHSSDRVIVMENVEAPKITDVAAMQEAGIDPAEVAETLLDVYFDQVFREGFFHADPHPGNLFIRPRPDVPWPPEDADEAAGGRPFWLIFVDFGMVGRVHSLMGDNLRQVLVSVTQRDGRKLTEAYQKLGFFLPGADLVRIAEAQEAVLDRIWGRNLLDLARPDPAEIEELGQEFRDLLFDFPFQIPQDFIYLGRAMGIVSGLVSQLDEQINPWYFIEKYGEALVASREGQKFGLETAWQLVRPYLSTPAQIQRLLNLAENGRLRVQADRETLRQYERIEKKIGQLGWSILGAAGVLSGTLLYLNRQRKEE
ncbi:MAG: AarF/ABC1/UbiB kinase family protein [Ardenticatenaceae bacterium]|nr:AarF/ABC1/UbiB kinase family protein [Anaerolineales bacterium]MCB8937705.1 AarF/ABC1/UbiB kinase family protein [Ardenticatenaceae bacterium]MCB8974274.1 AarF/ABC1/UbiB kinase family protein [Ardenticatenaceae bacterium]